MEKKLIGLILVASLAVVFIAGYGYSIYSQSNQTESPDARNSTSPVAPTQPTESPNKITNYTVSAPISFPTLSVPEFTLVYADHSYDAAATYKFDEYTGQMVVDKECYRVTRFTVDITIKNQPFSYSFNGTTYNLYYNIRTKGHFGQNWYPVNVFNRTKSIEPYVTAKYVNGPIQSNAEYTVFHYTAEYFSKGDQVDIQVQAVIGHAGQAFVQDSPVIFGIGHYEPAVLVDVEGDWSSTQTITIDNATVLNPIVPSPP